MSSKEEQNAIQRPVQVFLFEPQVQATRECHSLREQAVNSALTKASHPSDQSFDSFLYKMYSDCYGLQSQRIYAICRRISTAFFCPQFSSVVCDTRPTGLACDACVDADAAGVSTLPYWTSSATPLIFVFSRDADLQRFPAAGNATLSGK